MTVEARWSPGWAYWATVLLGLPAASGAILWAVSTIVPLSDASTAVEIVALAALAGAAAFALWRLPRLRAMTTWVRATWAVLGAGFAFVATLGWFVGLVLGLLYLACHHGGCSI
jgi:hypothetical protein